MDVIGNEDFVAIVDKVKPHKPFPHTLLHGPSGAGKTTLGKYIAYSLNKEYVGLYAPELDRMMLSFWISSARDGDLIIIDEIHAAKRGMLELIYQPMEDYVFQGEKTGKFTLIGITTDLNKLSDALIRRFRLVYRVNLMSIEELVQVITLVSKTWMDEDVAEAIAFLSRGVPGYARNHTELVESMFPSPITRDTVLEYRALKHLDEMGLEDIDLAYMRLLGHHTHLALSTISSMLVEQERTIEEKIEPYIFRLGLAVKTPQGRTLTPTGRAYIRRKQ